MMPELPASLPAAPPGAVVRMIFASPGARMEMFRKLEVRVGLRALFW